MALYSIQSRACSRAFTLVEAVMALVVMAVTLTPLLMAMTQAAESQIGPIAASRARWLATEKMEGIIADRHSSTRGWSYISTSNYTTENPISTDSDFTRSVTIAETAADLQSSGTGYKSVTVTVSWTNLRGESRTLTLATVLTSFS